MSAARQRRSEAAVAELEKVILEVLAEAAEQDECIGAAEISRRAGIHRLPGGAPGGTSNWNDGIATHVLNKLLQEQRVARCDLNATQKGWKLP